MNHFSTCLVFAALALAGSRSAQAFDIQFSFLPGTPLAAQQAVLAAGAQWRARLADPVTLKMTVGLAGLQAGVLGDTQAASVELAYRQLRPRLVADQTSSADAGAVASLPGTDFVPRLINLTSDNPAGPGALQPYLDTSAFGVNLTSANARALGVVFGAPGAGLCAAECDALIRFANGVAFDFDRSDGIASGQFDFQGVAEHEIGHALGFVSGVDVLDFLSPPFAGPFPASLFLPTTLDLFRYSAQSAAAGAVDFTADARPKFLSADGGRHAGPAFSTGETQGNGWQASHWLDNPALGLMAPRADPGRLLDIGDNDLLALDLIGWNLAAPVPEPGSVALWAVAAAALLAWRRRSAAAPISIMRRRPASP